MLYSSEFAGMC